MSDEELIDDLKYRTDYGSFEDFDKVSKLIDLYNKEKEKNKIIFDENAHWKASYFKLSRKIDTVSKDKIKEILEKYLIENRKKFCNLGCYVRDNATSEQERIAGAINVLNKIKKELLEE